MFSTIATSLRAIGRARRRRLAAVGLFSILVSGLEAIAAILVAVILRFVLEPGAEPVFPVVGNIGRFLPGDSYEELVVSASLAFAAFFVLRGLAHLIQQYIAARVAENTGLVVGHRLATTYLRMPYERHLNRNSSELIRNAHENVQQLVADVFGPLAILMAEVTTALAMVVVLLVISPLATLAVAIVMGIIVGASMGLVQPRLKHHGRRKQDASKVTLQLLQQSLGGIRDIKILGREQFFSDRIRSSRATMSSAGAKRHLLSAVPRVALETSLMLLILGGTSLAVVRGNAGQTLSMLGVLAYAGLRMQPSLQKIAAAMNSMRFAEAAVTDVIGDLDGSATLSGRRDATPERAARDGVLPFRNEVEFRGVAYSYPAADRAAVRGIDLTISFGESIGICGQTGGGKSTFLDLLCGLVAPTAGTILVDGHNIARDAHAWQQNIGFVHQSSFLLDDTIRRNIALGLPDDDVDEGAVLRAIEAAGLSDVVHGLPIGLDTVVGERGIRLSGGQRQRVTLARALYRNPRLLLLDEGTSALDMSTERAIVRRLDALRGEVTLVMVAHRIASIAACDRILYFEDGHIAASGTYRELFDHVYSFRAMAT